MDVIIPDLAAIVREAAPEDLPRLRALLAEADSIALRRLTTPAPVDASHKGEDRNLSVQEVAQRLNLSRCTLYRMAQRRELPFAVRVGRRLTFSAKGLEKWNRQRMGA